MDNCSENAIHGVISSARLCHSLPNARLLVQLRRWVCLASPKVSSGLSIVIDTHRLISARWSPSEHCEPRPLNQTPELIVVHCISLPEGQFGTGHPRALFLGQLDCSADENFEDLEGIRVAPHLLIDRGGYVEQFVPFDQVAWHAGVSSWRGRQGCNGYSIGIELEGCVGSKFDDKQYERLADIVVSLIETYPSLSVEALVGHNEIAPGRKSDPGPLFEWPTLYAAIYGRLGGPD